MILIVLNLVTEYLSNLATVFMYDIDTHCNSGLKISVVNHLKRLQGVTSFD
eukprot:SAG11_NODE_719_length_7564_cov_14.939317_10_plen_51_part_00